MTHSEALQISTHTDPAPFLKWAGGKTQLLPQLERLFPAEIPRYIEPFLGSGAVFFFLRGRGRLTGEVVLADNNAELINTFRVVQQNVEELIELLTLHKACHDKTYYYQVRAEAYTPDVRGAARTLYLNKTGFNGLYRVNRQGQFNVPMGAYKNPSIFNADTLRCASRVLDGARLVAQSFQESLQSAGKGDMIYLDPPYVPLSLTASFTGYMPGGFGLRDQEELAACVRAAHERGARFILSNSYTETVCRLYEGFSIRRVPARRRINCDGEKRGPVDEAIVFNFDSDPEVNSLMINLL